MSDLPDPSPAAGAPADLPGAHEVVAFWRAAEPLWFRKDDAFDRRFRERFLDLHLAAARGEREAWRASPDGALALAILLDQFPRNAFRGTPHMFATDAQARDVARRAIEAGHFDAVDPALRAFFCLPFAHSEDAADQDLSLELHRRIGPPWVRHAEEHRAIVHRFGRFPHRNRILGRPSTAEELDFLRDGGFAG